MELDGEGPVRLDSDGRGSAAAWDVAAAAVLRKARRMTADDPASGVWQMLSRTTVEDLRIPPLGTPERAEAQGGYRVPATQRTAPGWDIRSHIADPDPAAASSAAVADLENGATSLWVTVGAAGTAPDDLNRALQGVFLDMAPVVLSADGDVTDVQAAQALAGVLRLRDVTPDAGTCLGADPVGRALRSGANLGVAEMSAAVGEISSLASGLGVRALVVDGTAAHRVGAGDAGELGYAMAVGAAYLRALQNNGFGVAEALRLLEFRIAATAEQFSTIAKVRALRVLWDRVAELSGVATQDRGQFVHAVTSPAMLTRYDPWVNLLRTTVAAFAAGVGGADAVTVLPFDTRLGIPDALGRRMARNTSSLLISESHVAAVTDPAAGSHAVEILTAELADAGWAEFQRIEAAGGILSALADGSLRARLSATKQARRRRIATRQQPITGVSEFPNLREMLPTRPSRPDPGESDAWADDFEVLRLHPVEEPVFLATLGPVAAYAARAGFVTNLFAAGGIDSVTAGATTGVDDVAGAFVASGCTVACLAGPDPAYAEIGPAVVAALRAAGARAVLIAGKPRGDLAGQVDDQVAVGDDVIEFLRRTRAQLIPAEATS